MSGKVRAKSAKSKKTKAPVPVNSTPLDSQSGGDKQQYRFNVILAAIQKSGTVSVDELSAELGVSAVTVRRDLDILEQRGLLSRTHGGAVSIEPLFYEPFKKDRSFLAQVERLADEKRRIGNAAAAMIEPGETVAVTPGTTTAEVIRSIPLNSNITVVTNTANIAMVLSKRKDVNVFVTGGQLHGEWFSLVGPGAIRNIDNMLISTMFVGADGIDAKWGASSFSEDEAEVNAAMANHSRRRIAVVDHTKLGKVANWRICQTTALDALITDAGADEELLKPFRKLGVKVITV